MARLAHLRHASALFVLIVVRGSLLAGAALLLAGCWDLGECLGGPEIEASTAPYGPSTVVLDGQHPMAEQRFVVHVTGAALPASGIQWASLVVLPDAQFLQTNGQSTPPAYPAGLVVTIIRNDTNEIVPAMLPADRSGSPFPDALTSVPLDCPSGQTCDRTYRVRFADPSLAQGERLSLGWDVAVDIHYAGIDAKCGIPSDATATIRASDPASIESANTATASEATGLVLLGGSLEARHVTVTSQGPKPNGASIRLSIRPPPPVQVDTPWKPWVRVLADGSTSPAVSLLVGGSAYPGTSGGTVDVPVLGDCPGAGMCQRGYWVVFQSYSVAPIGSLGSPTAPVTLGDISWSATGSTAFAGSAPDLATFNVATDDVAQQALGGVLDGAADPVTLPENHVPTAVEATFSLPVRPPSTGGLDPLAASAVIVHVQGEGVSLTTHLEGDGAGPQAGYFNGDGSANLIAHPLDACPPTGPCTVHLQLVGTFNVEEYGTQASSARLTWSLTVLGAPAGLTISFGQPHQVPPPFNPASSAAIALGVGTVAGVVMAVLLVLRRRRRRRNAQPAKP